MLAELWSEAVRTGCVLLGKCLEYKWVKLVSVACVLCGWLTDYGRTANAGHSSAGDANARQLGARG